MSESDEQELHEFMRLKQHSHRLKNSTLWPISVFRDRGVGGSNPLSPTNSNRSSPDAWVTERTGWLRDVFIDASAEENDSHPKLLRLVL
jgi:hypothetical protein